jgi:hypothetical protein
LAKKPLTSLSDLKAKEISLVKRGANKKRRFPVYKQESQMDPEMIEILKSVLDEEIEDEAALVEFIEKQKLGEKEANALKAAMRILNAFKEDSTIKTIMGAMSKAAGLSKGDNPFPPKKPEMTTKAEDEADPDDTDTDPKKEDDVPDTKIPEAVQKQLDDANARAEKIEKANEELEKNLKAETRKREKTELVAKCKELYSHVPGLSTDEQAEMLQGLDEKGREQIEKQWAATEEAMSKSALLQSAGGAGADAESGSAHQKLLKIAEGLVEKSTDGLTPEAAYVKAMDANPKLYQEYLAEHPKQTG